MRAVVVHGNDDAASQTALTDIFHGADEGVSDRQRTVARWLFGREGENLLS